MCEAFSAPIDAATTGSRSAQSWPLRVTRRTPAIPFQARKRYPSNFTSENQPDPFGGCRTSVQSWGAWLAGGKPRTAPGAGADAGRGRGLDAIEKARWLTDRALHRALTQTAFCPDPKEGQPSSTSGRRERSSVRHRRQTRRQSVPGPPLSATLLAVPQTRQPGWRFSRASRDGAIAGGAAPERRSPSRKTDG
jgi:hypothetical protein